MKWIVAIFIFVSMNLLGAGSDEVMAQNSKPGPLFVGLGGNCHPALNLRACGLRKAAYPFDWLLTLNYDGFIKLLDDDFEFFIADRYLTRSPLFPTLVVNSYYDVTFSHDGPFSECCDEQIYSQQVLGIKEKYPRRINRFRELRGYRGKVFFLREFWSEPCQGANGEFNENSNHALALRDALDRYFPGVDYSLVIISYNDLNIPALVPIDRVVEFKIGRSEKHFQVMFNTLMNGVRP